MAELKGQALRAAVARLRAYLAEGKSHEQCAEALGLTWGEYEKLVEKFYAIESEEVRSKPTERVYVDYCLEQRQNIADLTTLLTKFSDSNQHGAMVGAIRARSDILDKMIAKGQEFGFIAKKPEAKIIAGIMVSDLSDQDLRRHITGELANLGGLLDRFGKSPETAATILDVSAGPTHLPTPKEKAKALGPGEKGGIKRSKNKVHRGRRVTKEKAGT